MTKRNIELAARKLRHLCRKAADQRGVAAVELALLTPILALMAVGTADFGLATYSDMQVQNSAAAGATYAFLHGYSADGISSAITSATRLSGISASPAPTEFCGCPGTSGVNSVACGSICPSGNTAGTYVKASATVTYATLLSY